MVPEMAPGVAKKSNVPKVKKCHLRQQQQQQKCYPLEPVLEDCEAKVDEAPRKQWPTTREGSSKRFFGSKSVLSRLRDGYVKLMNDMASGADMSGVSAMYGCSPGQVDYPGTAAMASIRSAKQDEEMEQVAQLAASQTQKTVI